MECKFETSLTPAEIAAELIDTLWNVNTVRKSALYFFLRINRYIMECKLPCLTITLLRCYELIDTLWNVNYNDGERSCYMLKELIDTLWNVNEFVTQKLKSWLRINRYIMECKCEPVPETTREPFELIDTLWNVNVLIH